MPDSPSRNAASVVRPPAARKNSAKNSGNAIQVGYSDTPRRSSDATSTVFTSTSSSMQAETDNPARKRPFPAGNDQTRPKRDVTSAVLTKAGSSTSPPPRTSRSANSTYRKNGW